MAKIFRVSLRAGVARLIDPVARVLLRAGVSPNAVTVAGTAGAVISAIYFGVRGEWIIGAFVVTFFALTDLLDGAMARRRIAEGAPPNRFGALLDSTMDRVADAAIFGSVAYYLADTGDLTSMVAALLCLATGQMVSYVKARAEGLGMTCDVGIAERPERLILVGVGGLLHGFGVDWGMPAALWVLVVLSVITIGQRLAHVARQARAAAETGS
jgi:CDP-diacylglycerol---glycerol-3-phosphate 3-phosphatidyltransferase